MKNYVSKMTEFFIIDMCMFGKLYKETLHENVY